jgi:hypothetical protein
MDYEKIAEGVEMPQSPAVEPGLMPEQVREFLPLDHSKYQGIAAAKGYAQEEFSGNRLQKVHYTHEAMIDVILQDPTIKQKELAKIFDRSESWLSIVMGSDAFQGALAKRRDDLVNPELTATLEDRYRGLADQSLRVLSEKLETSKNTDLALKSLEISGKALGFGARGPQTVTNTQYVVALPPKAATPEAWLKSANVPQIEGPES